MKLPAHLTMVLAVVALGLAIAQTIHPFGLRIHPGVMLVVALLLGLRYVLRRNTQKRAEMLRDVPRRPLGILDEENAAENAEDGRR